MSVGYNCAWFVMELLEKTWHTPEVECEGCVRAIQRALSSLAGVHQVEVDLEQKRVRVVYDAEKVAADALRNAIEEAGYTAIE